MADLHELPIRSPSGPPERPRCGLYFAGHTPHYIQVRLCRQSPEEAWKRVIVMGVVGDVVVLADGEDLQSYRNHETAYLAWVVSQVGAEAELNTEYHALFLSPWPDEARSVFSMQAVDREPRPCTSAG